MVGRPRRLDFIGWLGRARKNDENYLWKGAGNPKCEGRKPKEDRWPNG